MSKNNTDLNISVFETKNDGFERTNPTSASFGPITENDKEAGNTIEMLIEYSDGNALKLSGRKFK